MLDTMFAVPGWELRCWHAGRVGNGRAQADVRDVRVMCSAKGRKRREKVLILRDCSIAGQSCGRLWVLVRCGLHPLDSSLHYQIRSTLPTGS